MNNIKHSVRKVYGVILLMLLIGVIYFYKAIVDLDKGRKEISEKVRHVLTTHYAIICVLYNELNEAGCLLGYPPVVRGDYDYKDLVAIIMSDIKSVSDDPSLDNITKKELLLKHREYLWLLKTVNLFELM